MAIKVYKANTAGRRSSASVVSSQDLTRHKRREKSLTSALKSKAGRSHGKITVRHRGGGAKRAYRQVDFKQGRFDELATVIAIEYDPNRSSRIVLVEYEDRQKSYVIAPDGVKEGDKMLSSQQKIDVKVGNRMPLEFIPSGIGVYCIELTPGLGAKLARSAGALATLQSVEGKYAQLKMPSGEIRLVPKNASASIGQVSNPDHRLRRIGKAGIKRHMGIRPTVRGKAMNPVDHRHGGGEGQQSIGLKRPVTAFGKPALGVRTRSKKKWTKKFIVKRRKK